MTRLTYTQLKREWIDGGLTEAQEKLIITSQNQTLKNEFLPALEADEDWTEVSYKFDEEGECLGIDLEAESGIETGIQCPIDRDDYIAEYFWC